MTTKLLSLFLCFLTLSGCARKPKHLFSRHETPRKVVINRLQLPMVKKIEVRQVKEGAFVTWQPLEEELIALPRPHERVNFGTEPKLLGYNVYRFTDVGFVSKVAINDSIIREGSYVDTGAYAPYKWHYLVRALFLVRGQIVEGPAATR